ncbi:TPA: hypothetical protein ACGUU0_004719 [Vibrio vulnificus]
MNSINCTSKNNEQRSLVWEIDDSKGDIYFGAWVGQPGNIGDGLELVLVPIDDDKLWIKFIGRPDFMSGWGVPEAAILAVAQYYSKQVVSTQTRSNCGNYWRSEDASKMWERLCAKGKARFDQNEDRYMTI